MISKYLWQLCTPNSSIGTQVISLIHLYSRAKPYLPGPLELEQGSCPQATTGLEIVPGSTRLEGRITWRLDIVCSFIQLACQYLFIRSSGQVFLSAVRFVEAAGLVCSQPPQ